METNKTITEDYVSFETAQLLKKAGFNVPVRTFYNPKYRGEKVSDGTALINYNADPKDGSVLCSAPTLQMACKWLRNVHNIIITIDFDKYESCDDDTVVGFGFTIQKKETPDEYDYIHQEVFDTHEEATEAAIKYCLTELIK